MNWFLSALYVTRAWIINKFDGLLFLKGTSSSCSPSLYLKLLPTSCNAHLSREDKMSWPATANSKALASKVGKLGWVLAKESGTSARSAFLIKDNAGGPAPETLSLNESLCMGEEGTSVATLTRKVATLADLLRDEHGLLIVRPTAGWAYLEVKSSRYKIQKSQA